MVCLAPCLGLVVEVLEGLKTIDPDADICSVQDYVTDIMVSG